jgi:hypothetical protein
MYYAVVARPEKSGTKEKYRRPLSLSRHGGVDLRSEKSRSTKSLMQLQKSPSLDNILV